MDLVTGETFEAEDPAGLPKDETSRAAVEQVANDVDGAAAARPLVEPFVGPAILSGRAAGVFFHEIFGHRIEGHRQKDETEGQTFTKSVGTPVLPEFLSVVFDPTRAQRSAGTDAERLVPLRRRGREGAPRDRGRKGHAEDVPDVALARFAASRIRTATAAAQPGFEVVSRQSNLIVESATSRVRREAARRC